MLDEQMGKNKTRSYSAVLNVLATSLKCYFSAVRGCFTQLVWFTSLA